MITLCLVSATHGVRPLSTAPAVVKDKLSMRSTLGFAALLGIALVGARKKKDFDGFRTVLDKAAAIHRNTSTGPDSSRDGNIISGMYLVEFADGHVGSHLLHILSSRLLLISVKDNTSFYTSLHANGIGTTPRMGLNYSLFQGASFRINDIVREHSHASLIAAMSTVKQMWPLRNYTIPDIQRRNVMSNPDGSLDRLEDSMNSNEDVSFGKDTFSTHVMTQVDKLHADGSMFMLCPLQNPPICERLPFVSRTGQVMM